MEYRMCQFCPWPVKTNTKSLLCKLQVELFALASWSHQESLYSRQQQQQQTYTENSWVDHWRSLAYSKHLPLPTNHHGTVPFSFSAAHCVDTIGNDWFTFRPTRSYLKTIISVERLKIDSSWRSIYFLPRCRECRRGLAMRILFVCLSNAWFVTKRKKVVPAFLISYTTCMTILP